MAGVVMSALVLLTEGKSLPVLLAHKATGWGFMSMSFTFSGSITLSDMYCGTELGIRTAKMFAAVGVALIFAPALGALVMRRNTMNVYRLRLVFAILQLLYIHRCIPETLLVERRREFHPADVNPFSFLKLFKKSATLRTLAALLFFNSFGEGKNLVALQQSWMKGSPLNWSVKKQSAYSSAFGLLAFVSGIHLVPKLIRAFGPRGFTTFTNVMNSMGLAWMGFPIPDYSSSFCAGLALHGPGINNTSAAALKAMACDHAIANGFSRGEYGGMYAALRTSTLFIAPIVFGGAYQRSAAKKSGVLAWFPGLPWILAAFLGAALPEMLHRSLTDDDLSVPTEQQSRT
eukprot:gnl/MRDRNA2_/MRDRNA2_18309_c0_seq1.p1 gnl/MRDRNA2_/MRDRNA2_18309_c0~~gnl/MRDRNA2_/MRDRNA2_18309_c0_seq1.p1  ORF type:complete len:379 (+),score=58.99 gnl/MRDRNA2_/MRDRNA2_18309_c0_seq1:105-1139(+)